jgi:hypothetical protein
MSTFFLHFDNKSENNFCKEASEKINGDFLFFANWLFQILLHIGKQKIIFPTC